MGFLFVGLGGSKVDIRSAMGLTGLGSVGCTCCIQLGSCWGR